MKKVVIAVLAVIFAWQGPSFAASPTSSVDALIQKLEDKGILTDQDAAQLKGEISYDEQSSQQATFKSLLPDWLNTIKLTGDFRLRYQYQRRGVPSGGATIPRNAGKYRARLQLEDQINDKVKVIFGIATDGGNPRSNNVYFGGNTTTNDAFGKGYIVANKAYAIYTPTSFLTLKAGKMDNPIWEPTYVLWDPDITPEGGDIEFQKKINGLVTPFATAGIFVLHDQTPTAALRQDPFMTFIQAGAKGSLDKAYYKVAGIYYNVHNPSNFMLSNSLGTNTLIQGYGLRYNFNDIIGGTADIGLNDPLGGLLPSFINIPQVGVMGQYTINTDPSHNNASWLIGGYMGNSAINGWGTWKVLSGYKVIERDSWLDSLPDNDFYSGDTNTAGYRTELDIGLAKNVWLTFTLFETHVFKRFNSIVTSLTPNSGTSSIFANPNNETQVQADVNFRF